MKKILTGLIALVIVFTLAPSTFAFTRLGQEIKEIRNEAKEGIKEKRESFLGEVKKFMKKNLRFEARLKGKITTVGSASFSMTNEDGTFQINVTEKTNLLQKFGGKSTLGEYSVGDEVVVFGKFTDDTKTTIDAKIVKNNSIQKRFGAFFGKVLSTKSDSFTIETQERGTQTVYFGTAKIVNRKEVVISILDVKVGDRVRVKGVWDKTLSKISEVVQVKDFSIPAISPTQAAGN